MNKTEIKNKIRALIIENGETMESVAGAITSKYNRPESLQNLSQKLTRGSIKFSEVIEIADILGYDIIWQKR